MSLLLTWLIASPLIALVIAKTLGRLLDPRKEALSTEARDEIAA